MRSNLYSTAAISFFLFGLGCCAFSLQLSHHGFTGYDVSPMIDAGWRVFLGQVPGKDFLVTFPPSLYMAVYLSYRLFGDTWHAIALGEVALYLIVLALGLRVGALVKATWGVRIALMTTGCFCLGQTILLVSINYPWHSSMVQSFGLYAFLTSLAMVGSSLPGWLLLEATLHLWLATSLLILSKPNTAYPAVLVCFLVLLWAKVSKTYVLSALILAVVSAMLALHTVHTTLWATLGEYAGLTGRFYPRGFWLGIISPPIPHYALVNLLVYAILGPVTVGFFALAWRERDLLIQRSATLLALGAVLVAVAGMGTNFDFKLTDSPLLLLGLTIFGVCERGFPNRAFLLRLTYTSLALFALSLYLGRTRYRMLWAETCTASIPLQDPFLGSIKVCPFIADTLHDVDQILPQHAKQRVFFGTGLEFLYAGRHLTPPLHLPNWWDPGTSYPMKNSDEVAMAWRHDRFDLLILPANEARETMPSQIGQDIDHDFIALPGTYAVHVYLRRSFAAADPTLPSFQQPLDRSAQTR